MLTQITQTSISSKKRTLAFFLMIFMIIPFASCGVKANKIKKIEFISDNNVGKLSSRVKITDQSQSKYPEKIKLYKAVPRNYKYSSDEFNKILEFLKIDKNDVRETFDEKIANQFGLTFDFNFNNCYKLYFLRNINDNEMATEITKNDEELKKEAFNIIKTIPFLDGSYEYASTSRRTFTGADNKEYTFMKYLTFRRVLDGINVMMEDSCKVYFTETGMCGISFAYFDYEEYGEYVLSCKLLYVNQFSQGVEIIQPVYSFKGTAKSSKYESKFNALVLALP